MGTRQLKRNRNFHTFRLFSKERELLQHLGHGKADRYEALCGLTEIIPELDLPDIRDRKPAPLRLGIPVALEAAIHLKAEETGQPYVRVLLAAAAEYRQRNLL